jgi:hypothetical protein
MRKHGNSENVASWFMQPSNSPLEVCVFLIVSSQQNIWILEIFSFPRTTFLRFHLIDPMSRSRSLFQKRDSLIRFLLTVLQDDSFFQSLGRISGHDHWGLINRRESQISQSF